MLKQENTGIDNIIKQKIIRVVHALLPEVKIIYLYGSRARGTYRTGSDIDIALDAGHSISRFQVSELRDMLNASNIIYKIDVVDIHAVPEEMRSVILTEGILWRK
jgi:uncharacterized protein